MSTWLIVHVGRLICAYLLALKGGRLLPGLDAVALAGKRAVLCNGADEAEFWLEMSFNRHLDGLAICKQGLRTPTSLGLIWGGEGSQQIARADVRPGTGREAIRSSKLT